mmetsp:Transcript_57155/g.94963  ORF Transcript_57155/g.94963 Transcript_57155/m.94963 type:complete len:157 (-) Transcript_57155:41-511(-)
MMSTACKCNLLLTLKRCKTMMGATSYMAGLYLMYDSYRILAAQNQDLKNFHPASDALIVDGCYQYTRNPMYLGTLLTVGGGWTLISDLFPLRLLSSKLVHTAFGLLFVTCWYGMQRYIVPYEENNCFQKYGDLYVQYTQTVPRWIPNRMNIMKDSA